MFKQGDIVKCGLFNMVGVVVTRRPEGLIVVCDEDAPYEIHFVHPSDLALMDDKLSLTPELPTGLITIDDNVPALGDCTCDVMSHAPEYAENHAPDCPRYIGAKNEPN